MNTNTNVNTNTDSRRLSGWAEARVASLLPGGGWWAAEELGEEGCRREAAHVQAHVAANAAAYEAQGLGHRPNLTLVYMEYTGATCPKETPSDFYRAAYAYALMMGDFPWKEGLFV